MARVYKHAAAKRDLIAHFDYLAENGGLELADRFLLQAEESFATLSAHPNLGVELKFGRLHTAGIRKWHVKGFDRFLIFYLPLKDGVSIVRVLHAAQDWWGVLGFFPE